MLSVFPLHQVQKPAGHAFSSHVLQMQPCHLSALLLAALFIIEKVPVAICIIWEEALSALRIMHKLHSSTRHSIGFHDDTFMVHIKRALQIPETMELL